MKAKIFEAHMKRSSISESVVKQYCAEVLPLYEAWWNSNTPQSKKTVSLDSNLDFKQIEALFNNITGSGDFKQQIVNTIKKSLQSAVIKNGKEALQSAYQKVIAFLKRCQGNMTEKARQAVESIHAAALQSEEMIRYAVVTFNTVMSMDTMNSSEQAFDILSVGMSLSKSKPLSKNDRIEPTFNKEDDNQNTPASEPANPKPEVPKVKNSMLGDIFSNDDEETPDETEYSHKFSNKPAKPQQKEKKLSSQEDEYSLYSGNSDDDLFPYPDEPDEPDDDLFPYPDEPDDEPSEFEQDLNRYFPKKTSSTGIPMNNKSKNQDDESDHPYWSF